MPQVLLINPPNSSSVLDGADPTVTRSEDLTDWANGKLVRSEFGKLLGMTSMMPEKPITRGEACALVASVIWQ